MTGPAQSPPPEPTAPSTPASPPTPLTQLRGPLPRVMRLSPKVIIVLCAGVTMGVGGALYFAMERPNKQAPAELLNTNGRAAAEGITSGPKDYSQVPKLGPPLPGDLGRPILSAQQQRDGDAAVAPPPSANSQANAAEAARQRAMQERDAARTSRLFLAGSAVAATPTAEAPILGATPTGLPLSVDGAAVATSTEDLPQNGQSAKRAFLGRDTEHRTVSAERLNAPVSPYVVQAGTVIPAALITGIRSDLPGQITAQVTQPVYDSPTGRILLIPQGARLIGQYDSEVSFGQNRVLLAWDRLILPGGQSIVLERQPGADAAGFAGLQDGVNYHWGNMAKAALISTLLGAGTELASDSDDDLTRALRRGSQDTINQTGQQLVRRQLNVQPTLTIRQGSPLRVIVTRDLVLGPLRRETK